MKNPMTSLAINLELSSLQHSALNTYSFPNDSPDLHNGYILYWYTGGGTLATVKRYSWSSSVPPIKYSDSTLIKPQLLLHKSFGNLYSSEAGC
jgi:hypothetical protein